MLRERLNKNETLTKKDLTPIVRIDAEVLIRHMSIPVVESFSAACARLETVIRNRYLQEDILT